MICLDTNIIIYIANGTLNDDVFGDNSIAYPSIVRIEALGFNEIRSIEEQRIRSLLAELTELPIADAVIERAIELRQAGKMSLGDAIVAATALEHNCELWTANTDDFKHIAALRLVNPLRLTQP